jgi:hypothetical protein
MIRLKKIDVGDKIGKPAALLLFLNYMMEGKYFVPFSERKSYTELKIP